jgi:uncharacterized protein YqiB (DUF1249 family)
VVLTNTLTELFLAATKFPSILQLFSDQRTYFVIPSGFFSILLARSEWSNNAADSMALKLTHQLNLGAMVAQWLRYCATNRKVAGSIPDGVIGIFH